MQIFTNSLTSGENLCWAVSKLRLWVLVGAWNASNDYVDFYIIYLRRDYTKENFLDLPMLVMNSGIASRLYTSMSGC